MTYLQGFVVPVKPGRKDDYRAASGRMASIIADHGALRSVECWGQDVPEGQRTDFRRAVAAEPGEEIAFSWVFWPDKATSDAATTGLQDDPDMKPPGDPPFDPRRIIWAGYEIVHDSGDGGAFGYIDGMVAAVASERRQAFVDHAAFMGPALRAKGALRMVSGWGADVPVGKVTDFHRAVAAEPGETVTFGWIEWPSKATRDAAWGALMAQGAMQRSPPVWDGRRAIFGGFAPILDTGKA